MIPDNAHPECKELGLCVLREYKGYIPCNECSGSCSLANEAMRTGDRFGTRSVFTQRQFDESEKP